MLQSIFDKAPDLQTSTLLKGEPTQVFKCQYCEIFKNTYFEKRLRTAASIRR